jgi:hypothetical protein
MCKLKARKQQKKREKILSFANNRRFPVGEGNGS